MSAGVTRIPLVSIGPNSTNVFVVGVIIAKQAPRTVIIKKDNSTKGVWSFTLRDSHAYFVNITVWGSESYVHSMAHNFHIGDVVDVINPKVTLRNQAEEDRYQPSATCPYQLTMSENTSEMSLHLPDDCGEFVPLLRIPTKPAANILKISDIHSNSNILRGQYANLLVAIQSVEAMRQLKSRDGRDLAIREVILLDHSQTGFALQLWDSEAAYRAESWLPRETILFIADMKLDWNNFKRVMSGTVTGRTVITENPDIKEAAQLKLYARTAPVQPTQIIDQLANSIPDSSKITTIMSCNAVLKKALDGETSESFTAVVFAALHQLDLDGLKPIITTKCSGCLSTVDDKVSLCVNMECPVGSGSEVGTCDKSFDLRITLADHTGSVGNCRLNGKPAINLLGCSAEEFEHMRDEAKTALKWMYLLKKCATRLIILPANRERGPLISVVAIQRVNMAEYSANLPMY